MNHPPRPERKNTMNYNFTISEPFAIIGYAKAALENYAHDVYAEYATEAEAVAAYNELDGDAATGYALATRDDEGFACSYDEGARF